MNLQKKFKEAQKFAVKYNPLDNSYGNFTWKVDPKFNFSEDILKNPISIFNLKKTKFNVVFDKPLKDDLIEIKIEVNGNATVLTSEIGDDNFKVSPTIYGKAKIGKTEGNKANFKYSISPNIKTSGKIFRDIDQTKIDLGWSKDLTNDDVVISFKINGTLQQFTSGKGRAELKLHIKT